MGILEADYETTGSAAYGNAPPGARVLDVTLLRARVTNAQRSAPPVIGPNDPRPIVQSTLPSFVDFAPADQRVHSLTLHDVHVVDYRAEVLVDELIRARGVLRGSIYARISRKPWSFFRVLWWLLALLLLLLLLVLFATSSVTQPIIDAARDRVRVGAERARDRWLERGAVDDDARLVTHVTKRAGVSDTSARGTGGTTGAGASSASARSPGDTTSEGASSALGAGGSGAGASGVGVSSTSARTPGDTGSEGAMGATGAGGSDAGASGASAKDAGAGGGSGASGAGAMGASARSAAGTGGARSGGAEAGGESASGEGTSGVGARGASAASLDASGAGANGTGARDAGAGGIGAGDAARARSVDAGGGRAMGTGGSGAGTTGTDGGPNTGADNGDPTTRRFSVDEALEHPEHFFLHCGQPLYLSGDLLFDVDKDELRPSSTPLLRRLARLLRETPDEQRVLLVVGHADETGGIGYNDTLSGRRARRVADWLVDHGPKNQAIVVEGRGQREPVVARGSPAALQRLNRRVEVAVQCP